MDMSVSAMLFHRVIGNVACVTVELEINFPYGKRFRIQIGSMAPNVVLGLNNILNIDSLKETMTIIVLFHFFAFDKVWKSVSI